jgi:hypothetical protein
VGDDQKDLSVFRPGTAPSSLDPTGGLAVVGQDIKEPYKADVLQLAPRVGFSWQPPTILHGLTKGMVVRAGIGLYFDTTGLGTWIYATSLAGNPAGTRPLYNENLTNENIQCRGESAAHQCSGLVQPGCYGYHLSSAWHLRG